MIMGARTAGLDPENTDNWRCNFGDACLHPAPALDPDLAIVMELFGACQTQWQVSEMSGTKIGIPRTDVLIEAQARGMEWDEFTSDAFRTMEGVLIEQSRAE